MQRLGYLIAAAAVLSACAQPEPKITKRYDSISFYTKVHETSVSRATVSLFSLPIESKSKRKSVFDLGDRAQAMLVQEVAKKEKSPAQLMAAVGSKLGKSGGPPQNLDLTKVSRRVVLTVQNSSHRPADRIQWLRSTIEPIGGTKFINWNKAATAYEIIDLGNLEFTQTRSSEFTAGLESPLGKAAGSLGLTVKSEDSLKEKLVLKKRIVDLNVALTPKAVIVVRQGGLDRDLEGNVTIDFRLKVPAATEPIRLRKFANLIDSNNMATAPEKIRMHAYDVTFPNSRQAVMAKLTTEYDIREVPLLKGDATVYEGDDQAKIVSDAVETTETLIPDGELAFSTVELGDALQKRFLTFALPNCQAEPRPLHFRNFADAQEFYNWMEARNRQSRFSSPIEVTQLKFVLCLTERDAAGTWDGSRPLAPNEVISLIMWPFDEN